MGDPRRPAPARPARAIFFYLPVGMGIVDIHSLHRAIGSPPSADYETVHLATSDGLGLGLDAWYRPSHNGAAVLMMSGGGDIRGSISHAKTLVRHGYGALLFSARGTGNSEGTVNSYGWGREQDAAAALDYLATRNDVQPGRVRALGLSTGADMAIDIAARRSGPKASLAAQTARSHAPHLLIAAGEIEKTWGELYDHSGGHRSQLWYLPNATHTAALRQYPREYERRVIDFFDGHLGQRNIPGGGE